LNFELQRIQQMHRDIVFSYPPEVIPLGSSPRCAVQGMYSSRRLITVQGHPEFNAEITSEILDARLSARGFTKEQYEEAMSRVNDQDDSIAVGVAFLKFLIDE
jgi:GMP synthase-like glutamine amidotransferase